MALEQMPTSVGKDSKLQRGPASAGTPGGYIPYDAPLPGQANAKQAALIANTAYQKALAQINQRRKSLLRQYGYAGDVDEKTGALTNMRVDPNNPYGSFQTLLHNSALASAHAIDEAEGRGLHGGLAHQLSRSVQYEHGAQSAQLGASLTQSLADYQAQQEQAAIDRDRALYEALLENTRNFISGGGENPAPSNPPSNDDGSDDNGAGDGDTTDPYQRWLEGQAAAAGQFRTNKPRGVRGIYVQ